MIFSSVVLLYVHVRWRCEGTPGSSTLFLSIPDAPGPTSSIKSCLELVFSKTFFWSLFGDLFEKWPRTNVKWLDFIICTVFGKTLRRKCPPWIRLLLLGTRMSCSCRHCCSVCSFQLRCTLSSSLLTPSECHSFLKKRSLGALCTQVCFQWHLWSAQ